MIKWIKKWYDYYLMRYKFRKGERIVFAFKITETTRAEIATAMAHAKVRETEIKYMYPMDFQITSGLADYDFTTNLTTIKIEMKLKGWTQNQ
jgi:hypothetical protein